MAGKAGRRRAAIEISAMAGLAGAEAGHVRDIRRQLCCGTVDVSIGPTHGMADLAVAKGIVKAAYRRAGRQGDIGWRRPAAQVTETANSGITRIGRCVCHCRRH
jgi:hypothetical protein